MDQKKKSMIVFTKYTPYLVSGLEKVKISNGDEKGLGPVTALCRCGHSKMKPYCDGSHDDHGGLDEKKSKDRKKYGLRSFEGENIIIYYNPDVCTHDGHCVNGLPPVFRRGVKPWIHPDDAPVRDIVRVIETCPSGALSYGFGDKRYQELDREPAITTRQNGPYNVEGFVMVVDDQASIPENMEHYALCRCGNSKNKPFCDGTHDDEGFEAD